MPGDFEAAYGLPEVCKSGITGAGQTIVRLEADGYPTARADADAAASLAGLPALAKSNFTIVNPIGKPTDPNIGMEVG